MFESKEEVKRKNSGCALRRKQEPSKEMVAKPSIKKELEALELEDLGSSIKKVRT